MACLPIPLISAWLGYAVRRDARRRGESDDSTNVQGGLILMILGGLFGISSLIIFLINLFTLIFTGSAFIIGILAALAS